MSVSIKICSDWLVKSKMLEILNDALFSNDDIDLDYIDSDIITFFIDGNAINTIDPNNINLDDGIFDDIDLWR